MRGWIVGGLLLAGLLLSGCRSAPDATRAALAQQAYPADSTLGEPVDVLVVRHGGDIQIINRTPRSYDGMQLWLNQQYLGQPGLIRIGTGNRASLSRFINRFGESYPTGSMLTPEKSYPIVLAELYDPAAATRYPLVVRLESNRNY